MVVVVAGVAQAAQFVSALLHPNFSRLAFGAVLAVTAELRREK